MKIIFFSIVLLVGIFAAITNFDQLNFTNKTNVINNKTEGLAVAPQNSFLNEKRKLVIVELFTSEGCSSCPSADGNLMLLEREQPVAEAEIVALSEHVDYWNRLGWTDPFSSSQFSARQNEYSEFFGKNGDVYTPQMIVDGNREFPGHDMRAALKTIGEAASNAKGNVEINVGQISSDSAAVTIKTSNLPPISNGDSAIVLLAVTESDLASSVTRGENSGRRLAHTSVVRHLQNIGNAANLEKTFSANIPVGKNWKRENLSVVAFVQETQSRKIIGAQKVSLKSRLQ